MGDPLTRVPELVQGLDVRTLPLSSLEGFVLSRIDGRAPVREIVAMTGLPADQVLSMLDRLCSLGASRWKGEGGSTSGVSAKPIESSAQNAPSANPVPPSAHPGSSVGHRPVRPGSSGNHPPVRDSGPAPAARRKSGSHPPVRRVMSESGISQPPPDVRRTNPSGLHAPFSANPLTPPAGPATRVQEPLVSAKTAVAVEVGGGPRVPGADAVRAPVGSEPSFYDPRELDEECDLPRERRKQVLDLFYRLKDLDYYEALDIPYDADKKQVRSAYFAYSKSFHPDTMFRKNLGSYKAKMEGVFKALTEAYETLSKKKSRDEYDAYLRSTKATQMAERALAMAARESAETARALQVEVPPPPAVPGTFSANANKPAPQQAGQREVEATPPREASDEARKLAQEVIARRLRGVAMASSSMPARGEPPRVIHSERVPPEDLRRQLAHAIKGAHDVTSGTPAERLQNLLDASKRALARGELQEATQYMRRAISVAPDRPDLRAEHDLLSRQLSHKLADEYAVQAQFEAKQGKWASAALGWAKVCEGRPDDASAHRQAAFALFKLGGDLRSAQKYAQQATFLAPNDVDARVLLAQIYLTLGLKLNAKRELDAALKLDPGSEIVKNLLSDLKG
jgi:tetratricopeptide (TPR) repeat protein